MEYAKSYTLRYYGTIAIGPNAGKVLDGWTTEIFTTELAALHKADVDVKQIKGRIEVYTRQFFAKEPTDKPKGAQWQESKRGKKFGGMLYVPLKVLTSV